MVHVLLLFGGESAEHEVSIVSARNVLAAIDTTLYEISLGYIDASGRWWLLSHIEDTNNTDARFQLVPNLGAGQLFILPGEATISPDVILPILHGTNGEDGTVQGLARLLHIPIVGCDLLSSAVCMNKLTAKRLLAEAGLPVVPYVAHQKHEPVISYTTVAGQLGAVLFVKPANLGSSVGVYKVQNEAEYHKALRGAHEHDQTVLIEAAVEGREIEIAVLGNEALETSEPGEIKPDGEFYTYESKYGNQSKSLAIIPAALSSATTGEIKRLAARAFTSLSCRGLARVDFFVDKNDTIYINELNTMPGFTDISMYPKLWIAQGMTYANLLQKLISLALEKSI